MREIYSPDEAIVGRVYGGPWHSGRAVHSLGTMAPACLQKGKVTPGTFVEQFNLWKPSIRFSL